MINQRNCSWFENWFDSPYYHVLYKDRDHSEAERFISNLLSFLKPDTSDTFLDLGCGKGRHAIYLNKQGYKVTGLDLSPESITHASLSSSNTLDFSVHDMRLAHRINYYDYVLNLFTSFGYFENTRDDYAVVNSMCKAIKSDGTLVIDFMNANKVVENLVPEETKMVDDIVFNIRRKVENGFIVKEISFKDKGQSYSFQERVKKLTLTDFEKYFSSCGLKIVHLFGNYDLEEFDEQKSDRLILIGQKA